MLLASALCAPSIRSVRSSTDLRRGGYLVGWPRAGVRLLVSEIVAAALGWGLTRAAGLETPKAARAALGGNNPNGLTRAFPSDLILPTRRALARSRIGGVHVCRVCTSRQA